jgi:hypothetical protein
LSLALGSCVPVLSVALHRPGLRPLAASSVERGADGLAGRLGRYGSRCPGDKHPENIRPSIGRLSRTNAPDTRRAGPRGPALRYGTMGTRPSCRPP